MSSPLHAYPLVADELVTGIFSRAVWFFENNAWNKIIGGDASETGSGPGSYDIRNSVWHVNCCSPQIGGGGGWGIFNGILGWTNSATYGSVLSYNLYWLVVILAFASMRYYEREGHWPLIKAKAKVAEDQKYGSDDDSQQGTVIDESAIGMKVLHGQPEPSSTVRELEV